MDSGVPTVRGRGCPSDDELAAFVEHALEPSRTRQIEAHVDGCATCREAVGHVAATSTEEPQRIGRYRLDKKLGAGGMGVVWQAWDPALEREIAIKLLHPELHDDQGRDRALREARALARLSHPNVVAVHDVGEHEGDVFIATELIDGESLDRWQVGKSAGEILAAYAQAARGLAAAHVLGLVHRDVKPSNILVGRDGRVRVGDFGLATNAAATSLERPPPLTPARAPLPKLTHAGERLGTPAYMAPEQQHSTAVDARADQYSLCLALAEALLGKQPGMDPKAEALAESGVAAPWPAIARGLSTRPSDRFPDLAPLVEALEGKRAHRTARRAWIGGGLVVASLAGVLAWRSTAREPERPPEPAPTLAGGGTTPRTAPPTVAMMPPWTWTTPTTGAWRLPTGAVDVAIADPQHAVAISLDEGMVIDLATGAITAPVTLVKSGRFLGVVRTADRVLAFGERDDKPAAWSISLAPALSATEIPLADPQTEDVPVEFWSDNVVVSGDGTKIAVCQMHRWPVIRDAKTLAVIRVLKGLHCNDVWFPDTGHVILGSLTAPKVVDLATGATTDLADSAPRSWQGPNGLAFVQSERSYKIVSRSGAVLRTAKVRLRYETMEFTPDGKYVVGLQLGSLSIHPTTAGDADRTIELPTAVPALALTNQTALITVENVVIAIDLANGTIRHASGNLEQIHQVAPRGGSVVVSSDKLRLWREGKLVATTDSAHVFGTGAPTAPITITGSDSVGQWDPATGERRVLRTFAEYTFNDFLVQHGEDYAFNERYRVFRGKGDAPPTPWFRYRDDLELVALDMVHERAAWTKDKVVYAANLGEKKVWALSVPALFDEGCDAGLDVAFAPDGNRFVVNTPGAVILFDFAARKRLGAIDLEKMAALQFQFLPTGELVFADDREIAIWDPKSGKAVGWKTPFHERPVAMGVDTAGTELALGYANGSLLWADLAQLRAHATHRGAELKPTDACAAAKIAQPTLDQLLTK